MKRPEIEAITSEAIEKARKAMESVQFNPIGFLKGRIDIQDAKADAVESSKARIRADREIKDKTKRREPQITVKVRRIQMPEEAKG